ncbi:hypothetical protein NC651_031600 [Populus alba x Populus x berolinensis]|nr:hypothetical protein NC651_031600 [Populus alba x Populus x berolinensis]
MTFLGQRTVKSRIVNLIKKIPTLLFIYSDRSASGVFHSIKCHSFSSCHSFLSETETNFVSKGAKFVDHSFSPSPSPTGILIDHCPLSQPVDQQ